MALQRRIFDLSERLTEYLMNKTAAMAFPGRHLALPPILLVALPKSGSIYLQRALRRTLEVQVHHVATGGMSGSSFRLDDLMRLAEGNVVSREHLQPRAVSLKVLGQYGIKKVVLHVRDPRGAIVSWTKHMDRGIERRGLRYVELSCELVVPDAYRDWSFAQRLEWQVHNKMPDFVRWVEDWLELADDSRDVEFLITDYGELEKDARALVTRVLDFYQIPYEPDWISMPTTAYGKNNIFTDLKSEAARPTPSWMSAMPAEVQAAANALVPPALAERFGWPKP